MACGRLVGVEASIAVGVAVGILAVLAFQKSLKVIVPAADVARLIHRIIEFLVEPSFSHMGSFLPVADHGE